MSEFNNYSSGIRGYLEALRLAKAPTRLADVPLPRRVGAPIVWDTPSAPSQPQPPQPQPALADPSLGEFEVNMVEALVGWKGWSLDESKLLYSPSRHLRWLPDKAVEAVCTCPLASTHGCGIYAGEESEASRYGCVHGQVYGWGRYIRGDKGWRAQFAYPKCFYLSRHQVELVDVLKKYHCPIYVDEPLRVYDPVEDGYASPEMEE